MNDESVAIGKITLQAKERLLKTITKMYATYIDAKDNVDGLPSIQKGSVETEEEGEIYYSLKLSREPIEEEL